MTSQLQMLIKRLRAEHEDGNDMLLQMYGSYAKSLCSTYISTRTDQIKMAKLGLMMAKKHVYDFNPDENDNDGKDFVEWIRKKILSAVVMHLRDCLELHSFIERESEKIPALANSSDSNGIGVSRCTVREFFSSLPSSGKLVLILTKVHGFSALELAHCFCISVRQAQSHQAEVVERIGAFLSKGNVVQSDLITIDRICLS